MVALEKKEIRQLKARAQRLRSLLKVGRQGVSAEFIAALDDALRHHELLKVKFDEFKDRRHDLAADMAQKTESHLVTVVGHVAVLYRPQPTAPG